MDKTSLKDQILQADDLPSEIVDVPEWGCQVRIIGMNAKDTTAFGTSMVDVGTNGQVQTMKLDNFMAKLLVRTMTDLDGNRLFSDDEAELLGKKSGMVLKRLADVATRLNGLGEEAIKTAEKN